MPLIGSLSLWCLAIAFACLAPLTEDLSALALALGLGYLLGASSGFWWADYWRKRDAWRAWSQARQEERQVDE